MELLLDLKNEATPIGIKEASTLLLLPKVLDDKLCSPPSPFDPWKYLFVSNKIISVDNGNIQWIGYQDSLVMVPTRIRRDSQHNVPNWPLWMVESPYHNHIDDNGNTITITKPWKDKSNTLDKVTNAEPSIKLA